MVLDRVTGVTGHVQQDPGTERNKRSHFLILRTPEEQVFWDCWRFTLDPRKETRWKTDSRRFGMGPDYLSGWSEPQGPAQEGDANAPF